MLQCKADFSFGDDDDVFFNFFVCGFFFLWLFFPLLFFTFGSCNIISKLEVLFNQLVFSLDRLTL